MPCKMLVLQLVSSSQSGFFDDESGLSHNKGCGNVFLIIIDRYVYGQPWKDQEERNLALHNLYRIGAKPCGQSHPEVLENEKKVIELGKL
jgi:hypothetical protein